MKIGFVSERGSGEPRIAVMPPVVERYRKAGVEVVVERRIGLHLGIADDAFTAAGAETADRPAVPVGHPVLGLAVLEGGILVAAQRGHVVHI